MIKWILIGLFVGIVATAILVVAIDKTDFLGVIILGIFIIIGLLTPFGLLEYGLKTEDKIDKTIRDTLKANYDNVTNYHNDHNNQNFVADGSRYTFDYDEDTKTLTVFTDTKSSVDAVFVDGVKQTNQNVLDNTDKKKTCILYRVNPEDDS